MLSNSKRIFYSWILICIILISLTFAPTPEPTQVISFKYKELDNYYLECLSLHDGPDRVIIMSNGSFNLTCADGHKPTDAHPIKHSTPFIH